MPAIKRFQTPVDFAVQYSGTAEKLFSVLLANGIGITDDVAPGTPLSVPEVGDTKTVKWFVKEKCDITTYLEAEKEGIGYWNIEKNFIVS